MKRKIAYVLLIILTICAALGNKWSFWRFLLAFEILYGVAMLVWVRFVAGQLKLSFSVSESRIVQGQKTTLKLQVLNRCGFPVGDIRVKMQIRDVSGWQPDTGMPEKSFTVTAGAERHREGVRQTKIQPVHCGLLKITMQEARLFDYMGLWSARIEVPFAAGYLSVLPGIFPLEKQAGFSSRSEDEGEEAQQAAKFGEDSQEIFDTRDYRRGDTLRSIHWKLSAKEEKLLVKEYSMPVDRTFRIFLEWEKGERETAPQETDRFLEAAAAYASHCLDHKNACEFVWYSSREQKIHTSRMGQREELLPALEELLGICPGEKTAFPKLEEEHLDRDEPTLCITLKDRVYVNGDPLEGE